MAMGDNVNPASPPRLANWLLRWFIPAKDREEIIGDLAEEFSLRGRSSDSSLSWYLGTNTAFDSADNVENHAAGALGSHILGRMGCVHRRRAGRVCA